METHQEGSGFLAANFIQVQGVRIRCAQLGAGEPVILVHGFPETLQTWRFVGPRLAHDFRVIMPDMKGFGYSDKPDGDYSPWGMADFLSGLLEASGIASAHLVATDTGLTIACAFALKYPAKLKRLVLMSGTVHEGEMTAPEVSLLCIKPIGEIILRLLGPSAMAGGLKKGFHNSQLITKEIVTEYTAPFKEWVAMKRSLQLLRSFGPAIKTISTRLPEISAPTLILWGQYESFFPLTAANRIKDAVKNSRLEIIADCGHFIQEEKPEEVAGRITSFLRAP